MMETCLDEGTLQAYLDGELSPDASNTAAAHIGACALCAAAALAAEQELALFSTAFAPAFSASVPTEKLRARLDEALAAMDAQPQFAPLPARPRLRSYFDSLIASLTTFTPRQATAFASFLVAVALAVVFALMQTPDSPDTPEDIASVKQTPAPASPGVLPNASPNASPDVSPDVRSGNSPARNNEVAVQAPVEVANASALPARGGNRASVVKTGVSVSPRTAQAREERGGVGDAPEVAGAIPAATTVEPVLADEKTYLSSIASLASAIEAQKAEGMTPTLRAEYERNLAVVNQAIISSRVAVRRNPQDTDAKEFLRAAYQNKVELLSAVADQTQLASGRD
jgi:hypothetical protein